jgi:hypothetical protein
MASTDDGIQAQLRNIEDRYGKPIGDWIELIGASGLTKHTEIVALLKAEHGMAHGAAHRVALTARQASEPQPASVDAFVDGLYPARKAALRPVHDKLISMISGFGADISLVPKKGYVSLRRSKQFAMIQPSTADRIDVGLILRSAVGPAERLEPAARFNALFTHRVRVQSVAEVDAQLRQWLETAYQGAG